MFFSTSAEKNGGGFLLENPRKPPPFSYSTISVRDRFEHVVISAGIQKNQPGKEVTIASGCTAALAPTKQVAPTSIAQ